MPSLPALNLPLAPMKLREGDGHVEVFDPLRQRYVALTPEEHVRQQFVAHLVNDLGYDAAMMANERSITLGKLSRRCDTVVYDRHLRPRMIVEYKRPSVPISQKVFAQICRYNSVLRVPVLVVSNGMQHFCCQLDYAAASYAFLPTIPTWAELTSPPQPPRLGG